MKKPKIIYNAGFTLIEILIVISIIGVLSSIVISSTSESRARARDTYRLSQIREVQTALELYYAINQNYPANTSTPLFYGDNLPQNWAGMIAVLDAENLIRATFTKNDSKNDSFFSLVKTAFASVLTFYNCSLQDPLYKTATDFPYSYGYVPSANGQNYKIRIYIETDNSSLFQHSLSGTFLDSQTTGVTACDPNLHYYCTGQL